MEVKKKKKLKKLKTNVLIEYTCYVCVHVQHMNVPQQINLNYM